MNEVQGSGKSKDFLGSLKRTSSKLKPIRRVASIKNYHNKNFNFKKSIKEAAENPRDASELAIHGFSSLLVKNSEAKK